MMDNVKKREVYRRSNQMLITWSVEKSVMDNDSKLYYEELVSNLFTK